MALPVDSGELYDLLQADTALVALLGVFTFKGGGTAPALTRLWPNEPRDQAARCSGVEVAIGQVATVLSRPLMTGETISSETFRIFVTQWSVPPDGSHNHAAVIERILVLLQGQAEATPAGLPDGLTGLAQTVIRYVVPEREIG
jgi:hypothetical protein